MQGHGVLVTGAASGIGLACVRQLLRSGASVVGVDVQEPVDPEEGGRFISLVGDVSRTDDCERVVARAVGAVGKLDGLIHCAAIHSNADWEQLTAAELQRVLAVNVTGSFLTAQAAARRMKEAGRGAILLVSSGNVLAGGAGGEAGVGGPAYVASKASIIGLVRSLARALGPHGVRVNGIMPGVTDTPMIACYSPEHRAAQERRALLGRIGSAEEIADVCCFLVSPGARIMTGEMVIANGGAQFG